MSPPLGARWKTTRTTHLTTASQIKVPWCYNYQPLCYWILFVLGVLEKIFVISVFLLHKERCAVAEIYLGNMAAEDLFFVCGFPFSAISASQRYNWPFSGFLCVAVHLLILLNLFSSIFFLMMVSIDRYLALVKTMSFGCLRRPGWAKVMCAVIWVFALALSLPNTVFQKVVYFLSSNNTYCVAEPPSDDWFILINCYLNLFGFFIPVMVITFCTVQIIHVLRNNTMQQFGRAHNEKKATWLVLSVLLVFIICWFSFQISTFIYTLLHYNVVTSCTVLVYNHFFQLISSYIAFSNSCINPLLYVMVGRHFRQKTREVYSHLLPKRCRTQN